MTLKLSKKEIVELILGFKYGPNGFWGWELDKTPIIERLYKEGVVVLDDSNGEMYILSEKNDEFIHRYIEEISKNFIKYMKRNSSGREYREIVKWFQKEYDQETEEEGEDIADYIIKNIKNYGYRCERKAGKYSLYKNEGYEM